jgi:hypothetical protein
MLPLIRAEGRGSTHCRMCRSLKKTKSTPARLAPAALLHPGATLSPSPVAPSLTLATELPPPRRPWCSLPPIPIAVAEPSPILVALVVVVLVRRRLPPAPTPTAGIDRLLIFINLSLILVATYYMPTSLSITLLGCHP